MENNELYFDNYGSVVNEHLLIDLLNHEMGANNSSASGASANVSHVYQKTRYNRRLELSLQLANLREHAQQH